MLKYKLLHSLIALCACGAAGAAAAEPAGNAAFRFEAIGERSLGLWENGQLVLVYNYGAISPPGGSASRGRACYFHPVYGLDGEILTDDFPRDHTYHRGLYFAWPHIKVGDKEYETWTARGDLKQTFGRFSAQACGEQTAQLGIENAWTIDGRPVVRETIDVEVHRVAGDARAIDLTATWTPLAEPLTLSGAEGKSYGGLNFRFAPQSRPAITVAVDANLPADVTAAAGRVSGDLLMTRLAWADFATTFSGPKRAASGAAIFVHPTHPDFPPTWMARHYGLVSVGWPGVKVRTFPAGEPFTCRYRLWIHRGEPASADIGAAYQGWHDGR